MHHVSSPKRKLSSRNTPRALLLYIFFLPLFIQGQNITTIAGNGVGGYGGDGGSAGLAQLQGPQGLALDAAGNIYIADLVNNRVRKVNASTGIITTIAGTGATTYNGDGIAATAANLYAPSALAFDANWDLYLTDRYNNRIRKINIATGIISTVAGTGTGGYNGDGIAATAAQLNAPNEVAFDVAGNLYIADWFNNRVRKVDISTGLISTIAGTGPAGYNGENIIATAAQINGPCGIIFDHLGNIYFAEYNGNRIRKITVSTGLISTVAGTGVAGFNGDNIAATSAQLFGSAYIKFDEVENMYIGDAINYRVRKIAASSGIISTIAGTGVAGFNGDNIPATSAELNLPFYVYFDRPMCNMYIADYANNRVRKISGGFVGCIPLAITTVLFTAENKASYSLLRWNTGDPGNDAYFEIERSNDSRNFDRIGVVRGSSYSSSYSFTDSNAMNGVNYYRIMCVKTNEGVSYSQIISVTVHIGSNPVVAIYPNPGSGQVRITSREAFEDLKIFNMSGQVIYQNNFRQTDLSLQLETSGIYLVQISCKGETITRKIVVSK